MLNSKPATVQPSIEGPETLTRGAHMNIQLSSLPLARSWLTPSVKCDFITSQLKTGLHRNTHTQTLRYGKFTTVGEQPCVGLECLIPSNGDTPTLC
jgi:hypothetical protein